MAPMKIVIFAGGAGTRLWPLSRKATPKQFEPFFDGKSTLQLAVDRVRSFGLENIHVSTNEAYVNLVREQVPDLPADQIYSEPAKRDVAAAVCLTLLRLKRQGVDGPIAVLWSDHVMEHPDRFVDVIKQADAYVQEHPDQFVFLGEHPRFANENLGWIRIGDEQQVGVRAFAEWKYRPALEDCKQMYVGGDWLWNPGYFFFDLDFVLGLYRAYEPDMIQLLEELADNESQLAERYAGVKAISFDNAILERIDASQAVVLPVDLGWSDPGTLYAMKELLAASEAESVEQGLTVTQDVTDALVYNTNDQQLVAVLGLDGVVVVNTNDAVLVCHKDHIPKIKPLLTRLEQDGLTRYL